MTTRGTVLAVTLLLFGWIGILTGVTLISDDAPAVLVLFPRQDLLSRLPEDVAVLRATPYSVTLASDQADLSFKLYQSGALMVLPSGLQSCFSRS